MTSNPKIKFDLAVAWEDATFRKSDAALSELSKTKEVLNLNCLDISKHKIEKTFFEVFGYSLAINPKTYYGTCVKKSNVNADARFVKEIISCPTKKEKDSSYEKIVDTTNAEGNLVDFRVPIFKNTIPLIYKRVKEKTEFFSDGINPKLSVVSPEVIFSKSEIKNILIFVRKLGLNYGELDILRDSKTRKIYIVDANTTPFGLHNVPKKFREEALKKLSEEFDETFLRIK